MLTTSFELLKKYKFWLYTDFVFLDFGGCDKTFFILIKTFWFGRKFFLGQIFLLVQINFLYNMLMNLLFIMVFSPLFDG